MDFWLLYTPNAGQVIEWFQTEEEARSRAEELAIVAPLIRQVDFRGASQGIAEDLFDAKAELRSAMKEIGDLKHRLRILGEEREKLFLSVFQALDQMEFEDLMEIYR